MHNSNKRSYTPFLSLMLVFIVPMVASWFLYYYHDYFQLKTSNHGTLVKPAFSVQGVWAENDSPKKWRIVYVSGLICDSQCEGVLRTLNQVKKALGKNSDRITVKQISPSFTFSNENMKSFSEEKFVINNKIYLVDPTSNLFMYYSDTSNPMNILKDLKRVLEVSQIG